MRFGDGKNEVNIYYLDDGYSYILNSLDTRQSYEILHRWAPNLNSKFITIIDGRIMSSLTNEECSWIRHGEESDRAEKFLRKFKKSLGYFRWLNAR